MGNPRFRGRCRTCWALGLTLVAAFAAVQLTAEAQTATPPGFRSYRVLHGSADEAAQRLRSLLAEVQAPAEILVDRQQNRVLIHGEAAAQQLAAQLLETIDTPPASGRAPAAKPQATQVRGYAVPAEQLEATAERIRGQYEGQPEVRVAVDARTQQVVVVATPAVHQRIAASLNSWAAAGENQLRGAQAVAAGTYRLQHISWRELEDGIQRMARAGLTIATSRKGELATLSTTTATGQQPLLQVDRRRDELTFLGDQSQVEIWQRAVAALDRPAPAGGATEIVPLRLAQPSGVQRAVSLLNATGRPTSAPQTELTTRRPQWGGRLVSMIFQDQAEQARPGAGPPAAGAAQPPREQNPNPEQPAGDPPPAADDSDTEQGTGGLIGNVQIEFLEGLDVIILRGNKRDVERVQQIIADIERLSAETQPLIEIMPLKHINSVAVVDLVTALYEEILSPRQGQVAIRALVEPNSLLLIGRAESVAVVKDLVGKLDQPMPEAGQFEIFRLKHVSAVDAEQTIRNFFVNRPGVDTELRTGLGTRVQVLAEYRSNSLIVQASPRDMLEVRRLLESIDVEENQTSAELRVFRLKNALAADLAAVLQSAISGQPTAQPGQPGQPQAAATQGRATLPSATVEFMLIDQDGGELLRSGILADVQVTADPNINALVVRAPSRSMDLIAALIDQLDKLPDAEAQIKVFTIVNGDATNLAAMLQQLFGQQVTVGTGTSGGLAGLGLGLGLQQQQLGATTGGETSLVPLRFAVDVRTNSIIASGSESDLAVVEALLLRLDEGTSRRAV